MGRFRTSLLVIWDMWQVNRNPKGPNHLHSFCCVLVWALPAWASCLLSLSFFLLKHNYCWVVLPRLHVSLIHPILFPSNLTPFGPQLYPEPSWQLRAPQKVVLIDDFSQSALQWCGFHCHSLSSLSPMRMALPSEPLEPPRAATISPERPYGWGTQNTSTSPARLEGQNSSHCWLNADCVLAQACTWCHRNAVRFILMISILYKRTLRFTEVG